MKLIYCKRNKYRNGWLTYNPNLLTERRIDKLKYLNYEPDLSRVIEKCRISDISNI